MRHTFFAKIVAASLVLLATGTAGAQDWDGAVKTPRIAQITVTKAMARALSRPATASEFSSLPSPWPLPQHPTTPWNSRNARGRLIWSGVALGLMGLIGGSSIGATTGMRGGMVAAPVGAAVGATFGVWLAGR